MSMSIYATQEQCECLRCEQPIPGHNVAKEIDERTGVQTVTALCDHCRMVYQLERKLINGAWVTLGGAIALNGPRARQAIEAIEKKRGTRRVHPAGTRRVST